MVYELLEVGVKAEGAGGEGTLALLDVLDNRDGKGFDGLDFDGLEGVVRPSKLSSNISSAHTHRRLEIPLTIPLDRSYSPYPS